MIYIFHGDDIKNSREKYLQKRNLDNIFKTFTEKDIDVTELAQSLNDGLFSESKTVCFENVFTKNKSKNIADKVLEVINSNSETHNLLVWEGEKLNKTILNKFQNPVLSESILPQTLFLFLESIFPNNSKRSIELFNKTVLTTEIEIIFAMIIRHFRILIALKTSDEIDETKKLADWQKSKISSQLSRFETDYLVQIYKNILSLDLRRRSGKLNTDFKSEVDFLLSNI